MATAPPPPDGPPEPPHVPDHQPPPDATSAGRPPVEPADPASTDATPTEPATTTRTTSRAGLVAIVVGALVLLAMVLVVTQRDTVTLPPDSPEATVQAFLQSMVDGDPDTTLLADTGCPPPRADTLGSARIRASVLDTKGEGDTAVVVLEVTEQYGSAVFDGGYGREESWRLARTPDGWRITSYDWPWDECWNDPSSPNGG
ncbi:hypothetical protein [Salsipaludibacter albus]|uniref:hypothetical protein n=1 Tax=Salsipaludibacter albus TaxID=2849650 RepID=UPI001EE4563F|nr:hypothetical protein [Salsipaludibacter albus]MBY5162924.1 hypothetical protein [Salsipaludibacter albus]